MTDKATRRSELLKVLVECGWSIRAASTKLGVCRAVLYRRCKDLGVELPKYDYKARQRTVQA